MRLLLRLLISAIAVYVLAEVLNGVEVESFTAAIVFALVLALLNVIVKPILIILTLPATLLTLGLFLFVINAIVVLLAGKLVEGIIIDGFWWALLFALLLSLINTFVNGLLDADAKRRD